MPDRSLPNDGATGAPAPGPAGEGEALRQSEERMRLMVEAVRDYAIFMLDPEGRVASWNTGAQRLKGYAPHEILGRSFSIFYTEHDRRRGHPESELEKARREGRYEEEGWRLRKDGSRFWANVVISSIRDRDGRHIGFAKVTRDMTERREAAERLQRMNEDLERRVAERTAELAALKREAEAFSYSVSHDLRAPLRALDGFSRLVLEQAGDKLGAQEQDYLRRIRAAAQRMSQLTDAMLMLSRLTRAPIRRQQVDLSALATTLEAELRDADPRREVEVVVARNLVVEADPSLMRIIVDNLLRNAWKFTRTKPHARIELGTRPEPGDGVAYFVRDNGVGFDPALGEKLFLPFQRLHRSKEFEGSGIGLATVHRIVERHGGRVWAEARPGEGATFYFTLGTGDGR